jgi:anti-sigma regulatory factor (Ser/Thr protein kinase)
VPSRRLLDVLMAANELVANAFEHAGGPAGVRAGSVNGAAVIEVSDRGPGLDDPLAGYLPPSDGDGDGDGARGGGLWIARRLSSRLELYSTGDGLVARLWA